MGVTITNNDCLNSSNLALDSLVEIQAGTRLWLESLGNNQDTENVQLICQNESTLPMNIKLSSASFPWIELVGLMHCNPWIDNRLTCKQADNKTPALLCAIARTSNNSQNGGAQNNKTSVTMRGIGKSISVQSTDDLNKWIDIAKPSIDLCRKMLNSMQPITLMGNINAIGEVSTSAIMELDIDKPFEVCALEAFANSRFPGAPTKLSLTFK